MHAWHYIYDLLRPIGVSRGGIPSVSLLSGLSLPTFSAPSPSLSLSSAISTLPPACTSSIFSTPISAPPAAKPLSLPGCPVLPKKISEKILALEYIDFADLLPDQLRSVASQGGNSTDKVVILPESLYESNKKRKRQIPDIATWIEVFSIYILALAPKYPDMLPELTAYQLLIVQHSRRFEYPSWLRYDMEFRQWAAINNCRQWSQIHPQLYAYAFTAHGRDTSWCPVCQLEGGNHSYDCPSFSARKYTNKPAPVYPAHPAEGASKRFAMPAVKRPKPDHCLLFNKYRGNCPYGTECKFVHKCARCSQPHPVSACTMVRPKIEH